MPRILFLTAGNVPDLPQLHVGREARAVRAAIATVDRDFADLRVEADVGTDEVVEIVLSTLPDIIHFSGHGAPDSTELDNGALPAATISRIVAQVPDIWCVVLNACFSSSIAARLVADGVPAVVGMATSVTDNAAIDFSRFFYRALAQQPDIEKAVKQAQTHLLAASPREAHVPQLRVGDAGLLATRSRRFARPEIRARFCVDDDGAPDTWTGNDGSVFVPFDLYLENAPVSACSVIYRLHESYNDAAEDPEHGQFHEVTGADDKFYLSRIDSEDDYTVEAYVRWNDGRAKMIKRTVTAALTAHYDGLSDADASEGRVQHDVIRQTIADLKNENLQPRRAIPGTTRGAKKKKANRK